MERKKIGIFLIIIGVICAILFTIIDFIRVDGEPGDVFIYVCYYFILPGFIFGGIILAIIGVILILKSRQKTGK